MFEQRCHWHLLGVHWSLGLSPSWAAFMNEGRQGVPSPVPGTLRGRDGVPGTAHGQMDSQLPWAGLGHPGRNRHQQVPPTLLSVT